MASSSSYSFVVETDPTGRFTRYNNMLGKGGWKRVYKGFDGVNGIEIAWSKVVIDEYVLHDKEFLRSLCTEAELFKTLDHENIVKCYDSWIDYEERVINMITELFMSETLMHYTSRNVLIDNTAIKSWCRQILEGLHYLHTRNPVILHGDVKGVNIFVNGNSGKVKLGDLGIAKTFAPGTKVRGVIGTPPYMAPEIFEGKYNQLVDIYAFGVCVLKMFLPGIQPMEIDNVTDPQGKQFIERCLAIPASRRPAAIDLLNDPFLAPSVSGTSAAQFVGSPPCSIRDQVDRLMLLEKEIDCGDKIFNLQGRMKDDDNVTVKMTLSIIYNVEDKNVNVEFDFILADTVQSALEEMATQVKLSTEDVAVATRIMEQLVAEFLPPEPSNHSSVSEDVFNLARLFKSPLEMVKEIDSEDKKFHLQGRMEDNVTISMTLKIIDSGGTTVRNTVQFLFFLGTDTIPGLLEKNQEVAVGLGLSTGQVELVANLMEQLITELIKTAASSDSESDASTSRRDKHPERSTTYSPSNRRSQHRDQIPTDKFKGKGTMVNFGDKSENKKMPSCFGKLLPSLGNPSNAESSEAIPIHDIPSEQHQERSTRQSPSNTVIRPDDRVTFNDTMVNFGDR